MSTTPSLSERLRKIAKDIDDLLEEYNNLRFGNKEYREWYLTGKEPNPPENAVPPKIGIFSSPSTMFSTKTESENPPIVNPMLKALVMLGELKPEEAHDYQTKSKIQTIRGFGVTTEYDCRALIPWVRKLAAKITYLLETKMVYSEEVKARYPELLTDLETARGVADKLMKTLANYDGILPIQDFRQLISLTLHYAEIVKTSALQLADYHEEYISRTVPSFTEIHEATPEEKWVFSEEEPEETE